MGRMSTKTWLEAGSEQRQRDLVQSLRVPRSTPYLGPETVALTVERLECQAVRGVYCNNPEL